MNTNLRKRSDESPRSGGNVKTASALAATVGDPQRAAAVADTSPDIKNGARPARDAGTERALLLSMYRSMLLIRRVEEAAAKAYAYGKIGGFLHLAIGQESVCVASIEAARPEDYAVATYREHGHCIAKGTPAKKVLAELYGKKTGCSRGLGGSMHMFDASTNFLGGYGIVGGHIPLATGVAFASKYKNDGRVTLCFFGEGATNIGAFHEALSLAALWKLPIVFICENNQYAMGTSVVRSSPVEDISQKAEAYGMARDRFETEDVLGVYERIGAAVERARTLSEPTLVECLTYRFRGHSMSDPGQYRTKEEIEQWRRKDPIPLARQRLLSALTVPESELESIEAAVKEEVAEATRFAEESEPAEESAITDYVYAD
jgi:pyruvate dehydrogenase E1 component alpha subunit